MNTEERSLLAIFDDEFEVLATKYQFEEITDSNPNSMAGGGGGGGGGR